MKKRRCRIIYIGRKKHRPSRKPLKDGKKKRHRVFPFRFFFSKTVFFQRRKERRKEKEYFATKAKESRALRFETARFRKSRRQTKVLRCCRKRAFDFLLFGIKALLFLIEPPWRRRWEIRKKAPREKAEKELFSLCFSIPCQPEAARAPRQGIRQERRDSMQGLSRKRPPPYILSAAKGLRSKE